MSAPRFEWLDTADPAATAEYERAFYAGFVGVTGNRLIRGLWRWDDAQRRLATRIPYADQAVFVERDERGGIGCAIAVNVAFRECQATAFGFSPGPDATGCCELLAFFTLSDNRLSRRLCFLRGCFDALRERGFHTAFATTAPRPLRTYLRVGGELLEQREVDGEARYFLRFSLDRHWMRRRGSEAVPRGDRRERWRE